MNKKKNVKLTRTALYMLILTLAMLFAFPLCAFCAEDAEGSAEGTNTPDSEDLPTYTEEPGASADTQEEDISGEEEKGEETSIFDTAFSALSLHASEILSALTFIGSLIIMICYKSGFLPMVKDGIRVLSGGVKTLGEHTDTISENTERLLAATGEQLAKSEGVLEKMASALSELEAKLATEQALQKDAAMLKVVLSAEVDMLYEIFMAAALPQYLKDKVGTQIADMKAKLGSGE